MVADRPQSWSRCRRFGSIEKHLARRLILVQDGQGRHGPVIIYLALTDACSIVNQVHLCQVGSVGVDTAIEEHLSGNSCQSCWMCGVRVSRRRTIAIFFDLVLSFLPGLPRRIRRLIASAIIGCVDTVALQGSDLEVDAAELGD